MFKVYASSTYIGERNCYTSAIFTGLQALPKKGKEVDYAIVVGEPESDYCKVQVWDAATEAPLGTIEITKEDYQNRL